MRFFPRYARPQYAYTHMDNTRYTIVDALGNIIGYGYAKANPNGSVNPPYRHAIPNPYDLRADEYAYRYTDAWFGVSTGTEQPALSPADDRRSADE